MDTMDTWDISVQEVFVCWGMEETWLEKKGQEGSSHNTHTHTWITLGMWNREISKIQIRLGPKSCHPKNCELNGQQKGTNLGVLLVPQSWSNQPTKVRWSQWPKFEVTLNQIVSQEQSDLESWNSNFLPTSFLYVLGNSLISGCLLA